LKHVLRFLNGTLDYGIEFVWRAGDKPKLDGPLLIEAYSDSSFADDVDTARTTIGHLLKVNNATVAATSRLTTRVDACVNHSELEALVAVVDGQVELKNEGDVQDGACLALLMTGRSLVWARGVKAALERRDVGLMPPTTVFVDNTGVLSMVRGATLKQANKAIFKTIAEIRERVHLDKSVVLVKIATADNLANALTKQEPGLKGSATQLRQIAGPPALDGGDG
jgi:hypothetical protein